MEFPTWQRGCTVVSLTGPRSDMPTELIYCTRKYYIKAKRWEKNPRLLRKTAFVLQSAVINKTWLEVPDDRLCNCHNAVCTVQLA